MEILLINAFYYFFQLINILLIVRVILSWVKYDSYNKYIRLLFSLTEPILVPFRKLCNKLSINLQSIDFSPLIALLCIQYIVQPIVYTVIRILL